MIKRVIRTTNIFVYRDEFFLLDVLTDRDTDISAAALVADYHQRVTVKTWDDPNPSMEVVRAACEEHIEEMISDSIRASGDVECEICHKELRTHPYFRGAWAFGNEGHYLNRRCDGRLVKL